MWPQSFFSIIVKLVVEVKHCNSISRKFMSNVVFQWLHCWLFGLSHKSRHVICVEVRRKPKRKYYIVSIFNVEDIRVLMICFSYFYNLGEYLCVIYASVC